MAKQPEATPERIDKLPTWVKNHITRITSERDELQRELVLLRDGQITDQMRELFPDTRVRAVRDPYGTKVPVAVTRYDSVRWFPVEGDEHIWIETRMRNEGELEVSTQGTLVVRAHSSNVFTVHQEGF